MNSIDLRIIPCLLLHNGGLCKTVSFRRPSYVGDPINAVNIFTEKQADELLLLDIDATVHGQGPNLPLIESIASQALMPVAYGGGVRCVDQMERLFSCGVEKVCVSAAALEDPKFISLAAKSFGSQSVVVAIDTALTLTGRRVICSHNARRKWPVGLVQWAREVEDRGAGEIVLNDVPRDGTMLGYDHGLIQEVAKALTIPVVALGGARDFDDMNKAIRVSGASAAAAGSLFVYHGPRRAVLISYSVGRTRNP